MFCIKIHCITVQNKKGKREMKYKIFILFALCTFAGYANETNTICDTTNAVVLVLHKDKDGTVAEISGNHWSVTLPYDIFSGGKYDGSGTNIINGAAACTELSIKSAPDGSSYDGGTAVPGDTNTFVMMRASNHGTKCWCKLSGPMTSWWVYVHEYADTETCASECTTYCANGFATNTQMSNGRYVRNALIDAVW